MISQLSHLSNAAIAFLLNQMVFEQRSPRVFLSMYNDLRVMALEIVNKLLFSLQNISPKNSVSLFHFLFNRVKIFFSFVVSWGRG